MALPEHEKVCPGAAGPELFAFCLAKVDFRIDIKSALAGLGEVARGNRPNAAPRIKTDTNTFLLCICIRTPLDMKRARIPWAPVLRTVFLLVLLFSIHYFLSRSIT
jgi:hypothetical protein